VLLNPRKRFRAPAANVAAVSWQASRYLLANAPEFVARLAEVYY
jgi:hypothetical protein